jgi:hypothetical protein
MGFRRLEGVPTALHVEPQVTLQEVVRWKPARETTMVEYIGADGHLYHEVITPEGSTWMLTRRSPQFTADSK